MAKLIIWVGGKPLLNGYRIREFSWSVAHNCYIYEGRELAETEFNEKVEKAFRNNFDLHPKVKIVTFSEAPNHTATAQSVGDITLEQAEAVMAELAPDRLKKKAGRPPRMMEVA